MNNGPPLDLDHSRRRLGIRFPNLCEPDLLVPSRVTTLYDMLRFYSSVFVALTSELSRTRAEIAPHIKLTASENLKNLPGHLDFIKRTLNQSGIHSLDDQIGRLKFRLSAKDCSNETIAFLIRELEMAMIETFQSQHFLLIGANEAELFERVPMDRDAIDKFPSAWTDMEEAGKCFALDRWTACVFHLMRVLEIGLKVMATKLGAFNPAKPNWDDIIGRCQKAIKQIDSVSHPPPLDWREEKRFYSDAASEFRHFKDAWRNHALHVGDPARGISKYTKPEAERILIHVRSFMEHLATRFSEPGI